MTDQEKIIETINKIRPFIQSDGGDIEFIKYENDIVYVKMVGACQGCAMAHVTLKEGVEASIIEAVPTVKEVVSLN